jgi:hypothetical protein
MKHLTGTVYRCPSGYWHDRGATIGDVIAFERDELGNDDNLLPDVEVRLLTEGANNCAWVALDKRVAALYGNPEDVIEIELDSAPIIASDGCGGLLVYSRQIHC